MTFFEPLNSATLWRRYPWTMATSHHLSSSAKRDGPADSTEKSGEVTSHNVDVVASTTSWSVAKASAMCQARMAGPAIFGVSTSSVMTTTREAGAFLRGGATII